MSEPMSGVNPDILKWARERSRFGVVDVATKTAIETERIKAFERGDDAPTYRELVAIAQFYNISIAIFFFPDVNDLIADLDVSTEIGDVEFGIYIGNTFEGATFTRDGNELVSLTLRDTVRLHHFLKDNIEQVLNVRANRFAQHLAESEGADG